MDPRKEKGSPIKNVMHPPIMHPIRAFFAVLLAMHLA